jgi:Xaa-Pro aminopeptidase
MPSMSSLPRSERDRRWESLQGLMADGGLDVLILAANDYRGHKGTLRWVGDLNLAHRYGYALAGPGREPRLLLPENLAMNPRGEWDVAIDYARKMSDGLVDAVTSIDAAPGRIGVVGLGGVMKVEDYRALAAALPNAEIVDAGPAFERVRAAKSPVELEGVREATRIAEACFERLLDVTASGVSERAIGAEMAGRALALGGEDLLFLTMYGRPLGDGTVEGHFGQPADRILAPGDVHTFSFELVGPLGYWMEFSRMLSIGPPSELHGRMNAAVTAGLDAGAAALRAGADPTAAQRAIDAAVAPHGASCAYWSGHGIGQDVMEGPSVGFDVVQDRDADDLGPLTERMVISLHPFVIDDARRAIGYMADTFIVGAGGASPVSGVSRDVFEV